MKAEFSESSYAFALVQELVTSRGLRQVGVPEFPSLRTEGERGWDVKLPGPPVFLQFKLAEYLARPNAREFAQHGIPLPYYRMALLHSRAVQHERLVALARREPDVYYVCPEFHLQQDFDRCYTARRIEQDSAFWSPADMGEVSDDSDHGLVFCAGDNYGWFCSSPRAVPRRSLGNVERGGDWERSVSTVGALLDLVVTAAALGAVSDAREGDAEHEDQLSYPVGRDDAWVRIQSIVSVALGCVLLFRR